MIAQNVVLATDFSHISKELISVLPELKEKGARKVFLTHVMDVRQTKTGVMQMKEHFQKQLTEMKDRVEEIGLQAETFLIRGYPAPEIVKKAQKEKAFILIASQGGGIIKNMFLGSTTYDVIRQARTPVFVEKFTENQEGNIQRRYEKEFDNVLLPVDFSSCSEQVIQKSKQFCAHTDMICLVHVIESAASEEELNEKENLVKKRLEKIRGELQAEQVGKKISIIIDRGSPSDKILHYAEKCKVNMIALAASGAGMLDNLLLGSTADRVVKESPISVLLFPCKEE